MDLYFKEWTEYNVFVRIRMITQIEQEYRSVCEQENFNKTLTAIYCAHLHVAFISGQQDHRTQHVIHKLFGLRRSICRQVMESPSGVNVPSVADRPELIKIFCECLFKNRMVALADEPQPIIMICAPNMAKRPSL